MNLVTCENCAVVLDMDQLKLNKPDWDDLDDEEGGIDLDKAMWSSYADRHVPFFTCPVCGEAVLDEKYRGW